MIALLANAWAAYSFAATLIGGIGIVCLVLAFLLTAYLPASLRHLMFFGGALLIASAIYGQSERSRGAAAQIALDHARALAAEQDRTAAARRVTEALAVQATKDLATAQAGNAALRKLNDDLQQRAEAGHACLSRDLSRRLRDL